MTRTTRPISWVSAARKEFEDFLEGAREICLAALTIAADGGKADIAKPLKGVGAGDLWVVHALQKKSTQGIKTPKHEIDLIASRVKRLKEMLR